MITIGDAIDLDTGIAAPAYRESGQKPGTPLATGIVHRPA